MISEASTGKIAPEEDAGRSASSFAYPVRISVWADTCGGVETGHLRAQRPQSVHAAASTAGWRKPCSSGCIWIAADGQMAAQLPQPVQISEI